MIQSIDIREGYYLELIDGSIWAVKGCCHERGRIAAVPRLVGGRKCKEYREAIEIVSRTYRSYLVRSPFTAREIPMVPLKDVKRIISPSMNPSCSEDKNTDLYRVAREVIEILSIATGSPWLIVGSLLYCASDEGSDIDVITYDADQKYIDKVLDLVRQGIFRRPTYIEAVKEALESSEGLDLRLRISKIQEGMSTLYYKGKRVTIQAIRCDPVKISKICSEKISSNNYTAILKIKDRHDGHTSPYFYSVEVVKVLEGVLAVGEELYAYSHRARYSSFVGGDMIKCSGIIEIGFDSKYINLDLGICSEIH
ncbi:MAG: hypothetical protein RQ885_03565 [Desulfurococcales archaeon]|jgi:predicted nucleotidyltransferase|nr:hypothetical protein [Desulfurococcales archaeon]